MKYCKKCGSEIPEGVSFCEKCGNPVGQAPKQGSGKKKWVLAISSGVIILAIATVGVLFATGIIGGKDKEVQTSTDTADIQETPSVTGEVVNDAEELEGNKQKDASDNGNAEDKAWEAYVAYKSCIEEDRKSFNKDYEEEYGEYEDYEYDYDYYNDAHKFLLAYVDDDNYPELLIMECEHGGDVFNAMSLYTYKNRTAIKSDCFSSASDARLSSYLERSGYMYLREWGGDWDGETMCKLEGTEVKKIYSNIDDIDELLGEDKILKQEGVAGGTWTQTTMYEDESTKWNILWRETVDESYTQFLIREKND